MKTLNYTRYLVQYRTFLKSFNLNRGRNNLVPLRPSSLYIILDDLNWNPVASAMNPFGLANYSYYPPLYVNAVQSNLKMYRSIDSIISGNREESRK